MLRTRTASPALAVTSATITAVGGRHANEDALGSLVNPYGSCYVISDGAGGHSGGGIASRLAVNAVLEESKRADRFSPDVLDRGFALAERRIAEKQGQDASLSNMSATLAALIVDADGGRAVWGHLGDTRIFHFRRGALRSVTRDHSVVQRLVDAGYVSPARAAEHPNRNLLYAAVGAESDTDPAIERDPVELLDGDAFLLCTDGFWSGIQSEAIQRELRMSTHVEAWLESMRRILAACSGDASDNYSAIGVWVGAPVEDHP
jgi:serine/threonine protein phosphatase PrpC